MEEVATFLSKRHKTGATASVLVVGEGCSLRNGSAGDASKVDEFGHVRLGGNGDLLVREIEQRVGIETRAVVLGHVVRGGSPSAYDRIVVTRLAVAAVQAVRDGEFSVTVCLGGSVISRVPLTDILDKMKNLEKETLALVKDFQV